MSKLEDAIKAFNGDFNCAQSIFGSYCIKYGLDKDTALKIATGFGGGMGRSQRTCGAVTGSYMILGLKYGMGEKINMDARDKTYQYINEFSNRFKKEFGSLICKELLGCDINTDEGKEYYDQNNFFENKCFQYVKKAAKILDELLD
jgi:C_GCAxxG_C_C family probable redox protein